MIFDRSVVSGHESRLYVCENANRLCEVQRLRWALSRFRRCGGDYIDMSEVRQSVSNEILLSGLSSPTDSNARSQNSTAELCPAIVQLDYNRSRRRAQSSNIWHCFLKLSQSKTRRNYVLVYACACQPAISDTDADNHCWRRDATLAVAAGQIHELPEIVWTSVSGRLEGSVVRGPR